MFPDTQVKSKHFEQLAVLIVGTGLINLYTSLGSPEMTTSSTAHCK